MYNQLISYIDGCCFNWHNDPANCFGAPALMEEKHFWDEVDLCDDEDLEKVVAKEEIVDLDLDF